LIEQNKKRKKKEELNKDFFSEEFLNNLGVKT
jgi:hypothetical protein